MVRWKDFLTDSSWESLKSASLKESYFGEGKAVLLTTMDEPTQVHLVKLIACVRMRQMESLTESLKGPRTD